MPTASCEKVRYESVYKGIDGARSTRVDENGDLVISADGGDVREQRPIAYQEFDGVRREVSARYVVDKRGRVNFELGADERGAGEQVPTVAGFARGSPAA